MTDYNDGNWHAWNGGECPVHPETIVDVICKDYNKPCECKAKTKGWWARHYNPIIAFRVVTEYRKPREFWIAGEHWFMSKEKAEEWDRHYSSTCGEIIHVVEKLED